MNEPQSPIQQRFQTRLDQSNAMKEEKSEYYNLDCSMCKRLTRHWDIFGDCSKMKCNSCGEYRTMQEKSEVMQQLEEKTKSSNAGFEMYHNMVEREAFEKVFNAFRKVSSGKVYFDDIEDKIQQVRLELKKENNAI